MYKKSLNKRHLKKKRKKKILNKENQKSTKNGNGIKRKAD